MFSRIRNTNNMSNKSRGLRDVTNVVTKTNTTTTTATATATKALKFGKKCDTVVEGDDEPFGFFELNRNESEVKVKRLKASMSPPSPDDSSFSIVSRLTSQLKETVVSNDGPDDEDYSLRGALKSLAASTTPIFSDSDESDVPISSANSSLTFTSSTSSTSSSRRRLFTTSSTKQQQPSSTPITSLNIISPDNDETTTDETTIEFSLRTIQTCLSMTQRHDIIMQSLEIEHSIADTTRRLIGDKSRHHALPTLAAHTTKHADLNCITPSTLKSLLDGDFAEAIGRFVIMDSRYPYEFEAGHIRGALNVFTKDALIDYCFSSRNPQEQKEEQQQQKPCVIIFHCEFSSERGPSLLRFLRSQDRAMNKDVYPHLFYPELYLLDGGYKNFYERHPDYCEPRAYKPMLHEDHVQDLKHFRAKTKTWEMNSKGVAYTHNHHSSAVKLETRFKKQSSRTLHRCPKSTLF